MKKKSAGTENEFNMFEAMKELEKTRGVPITSIIENIKKSIEKACKSSLENEDVVFYVDEEKEIFNVYVRKTVVDYVTDPNKEISEQDARDIDINAEIGSKVKILVDPKKLGRISIQNARSVIRQGIRDKERELTIEEFTKKQKEIVSAYVVNIDPETGNASIKIDKSIATLTKAEQAGLKDLKEGDVVKVYIADILSDTEPTPGKKGKNKGPKAIISRTCNEFIERLFELEVPEIKDGIVEIKAVAREPGSRTKIAVLRKKADVDPVGACIGARGTRVEKIVEELGGEKIDIIEYKDKPEEFIANALSPASVISVKVIEDDPENKVKKCEVTVPDDQLSLAIGNKGQNARLAARLTEWKIDIRPESGVYKTTDSEEENMIAAEDSAEEMIDLGDDGMSETQDNNE